jgi:hypothetical protein
MAPLVFAVMKPHRFRRREKYRTIQKDGDFPILWEIYVVCLNISHIVETGNESYRFQHSSMAAKSRIQSREDKRRSGKAATEEEPF